MGKMRDVVIQDLVGVLWSHPPKIDNTVNINAFADYLLARERKILLEIKSALNSPAISSVCVYEALSLINARLEEDTHA